MPTVNELAKIANISVHKLRTIDRALGGKLLALLDKIDPVVDPIIAYYRSRREVTTSQFVNLVEQPDIIPQLGTYADGVAALVRELDDPTPAKVQWGDIAFAASGDATSVANLVAWVKSVLPYGKAVNHHWLAVRLLLAVPEKQRQYEARRINRAMYQVREAPDFAGWYHIEHNGARNVTWYQRPKEFDL